MKCSTLRVIHITAFSTCVCSRWLRFRREIENFLSLCWCSPLRKTQTAASSVNQPLVECQIHSITTLLFKLWYHYFWGSNIGIQTPGDDNSEVSRDPIQIGAFSIKAFSIWREDLLSSMGNSRPLFPFSSFQYIDRDLNRRVKVSEATVLSTVQQPQLLSSKYWGSGANPIYLRIFSVEKIGTLKYRILDVASHVMHWRRLHCNKVE